MLTRSSRGTYLTFSFSNKFYKCLNVSGNTTTPGNKASFSSVAFVELVAYRIACAFGIGFLWIYITCSTPTDPTKMSSKRMPGLVSSSYTRLGVARFKNLSGKSAFSPFQFNLHIAIRISHVCFDLGAKPSHRKYPSFCSQIGFLLCWTWDW